MVIIGLDDPCVRFIVKNFVLCTDGLQNTERAEDPAFAGREICSAFHLIPVEITAVEIAAVVPFERVLMVGIIVLLADLVAAVQYRDSALGEKEGMEHDIQADGTVQFIVVKLILGGFNTAQGSSGAAQTGITEAGIVVVELSAGVTVIAFAGQIIVEIFLVCDFFYAELPEVGIIQSPADIVMAAQIIEEGVLVRQRKNRLHLVAEEAHIMRCHGVPGAGHGRDIVEHVALGFLQSPEIRNDLGGLHDDLTQKQGAGADNLGGHTHQADKGVYLRKIAAVCAQLFPDIGCSVKTDDVDAVVAKIEHIGSHVVEDDRICVVEIPLIGIESGHDHLAGLFAPGEIAGRSLRKDLRHSLFKLVGDGPVIVEEIAVLIFLFAGTGAFCPLVVFAGMVHDEVQADTHTPVVALIAQFRQIFHGAQSRLHLAEVGYCVAAVAASRGALQQRHEVYIVESALLQIIQVLPDSLERAGKAVGIHEHAQHLIAFVPLRNFLAHLVPLFQNFRPLRIIAIEHIDKICKGLLVIVIKLRIEPLQFIVVLFQALCKLRLPVLFFKHEPLPPLGNTILPHRPPYGSRDVPVSPSPGLPFTAAPAGRRPVVIDFTNRYIIKNS